MGGVILRKIKLQKKKKEREKKIEHGVISFIIERNEIEPGVN